MTSKPSDKHRSTILVDRDLMAEFDEAAYQERTTRSGLMVRLMREYVDRQKPAKKGGKRGA